MVTSPKPSCYNKKFTSYSSISVVLGAVIAVLLSSPTMAASQAESLVVKANGQFTSNLYKILSDGEAGNVFFSPISVHAVLSMAYQGAQGTTAECFASALQVPDALTAGEGYNAVMNRLNNVPNVTLLMANKVYLMDGYELLETFNTAITKQFLSEVQLLNFGQNEAAAATINSWVTQQTRDKIKDLISKDDLNSFTRLVLVNAIYFKGNWKHKFREEATKIEPFYLNNEDKIDVSMMHIKESFLYKEDKDLDAQVLKLPYTNEDLSMIIILPTKRDGIHELEKKLETYDLANVTNDMWRTEVNVALPKFKVETTIDLEDSLTKLGLGEIFDSAKANFRGMITANEQLYVSKVIQKAFIEVNEEGAEAAAATGMAIVLHCFITIEAPMIYFKADHPFIFYLVHQNMPLFLGKIRKI